MSPTLRQAKIHIPQNTEESDASQLPYIEGYVTYSMGMLHMRMRDQRLQLCSKSNFFTFQVVTVDFIGKRGEGLNKVNPTIVKEQA